MSTSTAYMELIQAHERGWGMETYPGRPTLADMLGRPVVAFWVGDDKTGKGRFTVTVHERVEELNDILLSMLLAGKVTPSSQRRLAKIFIQQKPVRITGLKLLVDDRPK